MNVHLPKKSRLLIVEDDQNLGWALQEKLSAEGYIVDWAQTLADADSRLETPPDLIILDWMLPDGQGRDFLSGLRKRQLCMPVIFLTARVELLDKILGLESGANDYMTKPFESRELLARIRVQLREREFESKEQIMKVGPLTIDKSSYQAMLNGRCIDLVKKEFELLVLLAEYPGKVFSREEILNKVWGYEVFPTTRTVDTHVLILRQKLQEDFIETVRSVGYRFRKLS
jgi:DNA-binding response OmpR family regulator